MNKQLNKILLIDDDVPTNFLHEIVIKKSGYTKEVVTHTSGMSALEFLTTKQDGKYPQPELIFLDINMPGMNGWEFIEHFKTLDQEIKGNTIVVVMLTTSLNPDDRKKAEEIGHVDDFHTKPLTVEKLDKVMEQHFS